MPNAFGSFGTGVMEYWSVEKKDVNPIAITPTLQYSNTPKLVELKNTDTGYRLWGSKPKNSRHLIII